MRRVVATLISAPLVIAGLAFAPSNAPVAAPPTAEAANTKFSFQVKCAVVNLRNEANGDYIYGSGPDKAAAVKDANNKLGQKYGVGFKLKHCRGGSFSGGGGSGKFSVEP